MKKILYILVIFILVAVSYCGIYVLQNRNIEADQIQYWMSDNPHDTFINYDVIRCNYNLFYPKIAFVSEKKYLDFDKNDFNVYISNYQNSIFGKIGEMYLGVATVKNTNFPQLVAMVKQDCSQFQYGYDNPDFDRPRWTYTAASADADVIEYQEPTEKEIRVRDTIMAYKLLTDEQKKKVIERYGPMEELNAEELIEWGNQITRDIEEGKFSLE